MPMTFRSLAAATLLLATIAACTRVSSVVSGDAARGETTALEGPVGLPPIPLVEGPLAVRVQYPAPNQRIATRDSNFIFGSVGNGRASLTINGHPVRVAPNGAFLAFLPLPPRANPRYELVATTGRDTARLTVPIRITSIAPVAALPENGRLVVDSASLVIPRGRPLLRENEPVRIAIRAPSNATVWVAWDGGLQMLAAQRASPYAFATEVLARSLQMGGTLFVARGADTLRFPIPRVELVDRTLPPLVQLGAAAAVPDTDRVIIGRPIPAGTYKWLFMPGTIVEQTGRQEGFVRVRLDSQLEVWVDSAAVVPLPVGTVLARRQAGNVTLVPSAEWVDVQIPMTSRAPYLIEQLPRRIVLTLYGTQQSVDLIRFLGNDTLVRMINWVPETSDRVRLDLELSQAPYGYLVFWEPGRMVLRLRRQPTIDRERPLAGLTLVVDPGHPPGGAAGPLGLLEPRAALDVSMRVKRLLEERGAKVVMTRTTMDPVALGDRSIIARRANAHALLSIHLNAFGDGTNPFPNVGTSVLFFHPQSEPLARDVQRNLVRRLGLRDLGIHYQNIAIGRTTWMPSIITEGLFLMVPEQEYAMRTEQGQEAYARAVVEGTIEYFRGLGTRD